MAAADNSSKAYKEALKQIENLVKKQATLKKSTEEIQNSWSAVASEIFKMDGAQFFKNVEKSPEQLRAMGKEIQQLEEGFKNLGNDFAKTLGDDKKFKAVKESLKGISEQFKNSSKNINDSIKGSFSEIYAGLDKDLKKIIKSESDLENILKNKDKLTDSQKEKLKGIEKFQELEKEHNIISEKYQKDLLVNLNSIKKDNTELSNMNQEMVDKVVERLALGESEVKIAADLGEEGRKILASLSGSKNELLEINKGMTSAAGEIKSIREESTKMNKEFKLTEGLISGFGSIIKKGWIDSMMKFDEVLNDVQKQTGINMDFNKTKFAELQTEVAQFGIGIEEAGKMMADMSKELNTTNFSVLSQATKDFSSIEGATGAAAGDITTIAGELMRMGESSGQVKDFMQEADTMARKFGVSSAKAMSAISRNIGKIRQMGFVGGEKSLGKMVATAERLRMNVDEIFDVAKKARSIEGAMDMAAELQLAGGSFSNINPMDLLAAARKGPAELQKILTSMGKDIGHFSKETGKYEFDPVDVDRLQMVAEATGQSLDSIQNMVQKNAEDTEKLNPFQGMMDGLEDADKEIAKSALSDMIKRGKDGKLEIDVDNDMAKKMGINKLEDINSSNISEMLKQKELDSKTLEEQNKRNQSLKKSFDNFLNALMSIFSFFQPAIEVLTEIMQGVTSVFTTVMGWLPGWSKSLIGGLMIFGLLFSSSVGSFIKQGVGGLLKGIGGIGSKIKAKFIGGAAAGAPGGGGTPGEAEVDSFKNIGDKIKSIATGIKNSITGVISFVKDVAGQLISLVGDVLKQVVQVFIDLGKQIVGGIGEILQSATSITGALRAIVADIVGIVTDSFVSILSALGRGISLFGTQAAVGFAALTPFIPIILVLTVAIIGLAFAFKLFAEGLGALAPLITSVFEGIAKVILSIGMAVSMVISTIADSIVKLSAIDAGNLFALAAGLGVLSLSMIAFGAASMIGGVMSFFGGGMFSQLSELALIAPAIEILANSLNSAADGIGKLSEAADKLSLDKLEKLKELSESMANAGAGGGAMAALANTANNKGGTGGDGEVRKIEVNVKMNGRDMQNFIVKDTAIIK